MMIKKEKIEAEMELYQDTEDENVEDEYDV